MEGERFSSALVHHTITMGLLDRIKAGEADADSIEEEFDKLLAPGESVGAAYKVLRDVFVFTDWRLILIDKQGITGNKQEFLSIPYDSVRRFSVETAGTLDLDAELKIWIAGRDKPIEKEFNRNVDIYELQSVLARGISGGPSDGQGDSGNSGDERAGGTVFEPQPSESE